jgi:WbqC-like protein family
VALMQPSFLPWQGVFALAAAADVFVFLDDFQFQRHSFHQRNRLRLASGEETWITVPVAHPEGTFPSLDAAVPQVDAKWRKRLKTTLDQNYGKAAFHEALRPGLDAWIDAEHASLAAMNISFFRWTANLLGITPAWARSSLLGARGERSERVRDVLRAANAQTYLAARGSFEYMHDDGVFPVDGIEVVFQDFEPVRYHQRKAIEFVSHLSVLDALLEVGPVVTRELVDKGQRDWTSWDAIVAIAAPTRVAP